MYFSSSSSTRNSIIFSHGMPHLQCNYANTIQNEFYCIFLISTECWIGVITLSVVPTRQWLGHSKCEWIWITKIKHFSISMMKSKEKKKMISSFGIGIGVRLIGHFTHVSVVYAECAPVRIWTRRTVVTAIISIEEKYVVANWATSYEIDIN